MLDHTATNGETTERDCHETIYARFLRKEVIVNIEKHCSIWDLERLSSSSNHSNFHFSYAEINNRSQMSKKNKTE